jgi:hypothetical protein
MTEWIAIARWPDCRKLEKPGIIFELQNASGHSLFTRCLVDPAVPVGLGASPHPISCYR